MQPFTIIDAPSNLGLRPTGVEKMGIALKSAGLMAQLGASDGGRVPPLPYSEVRDEVTLIRNGEAIRSYSQSLAELVAKAVQEKHFPIVLGGDCSILIGAMLSLRRIGRYGLFFVDAHSDFYQPEADPLGEVASMELAFITGRGPDVLANIEGFRPLVRDEDVVVFGYRDQEIQASEGSQDIRDTAIHSYDIQQVRQPNFIEAAREAVAGLNSDLDGFWIHLDADVLDDAIMPAVDYRIPGGLQFDELSSLLRILLGTGRAIGMTITIFNPTLDEDGSIARNFVESIGAGLSS